MFQFRRFPTYAYFVQRTLTEYCSAGFPHSEICGSKLMCSSPQLIAACHVLLRLLMPRHSPCALSSLTFVGASSGSFASVSTRKLIPFAAPPLQIETAALGFDLVSQTSPSQRFLEEYGSHELCRHHRSLQIGYIVLPLFKSSTTLLFALCCLLLYIFVYIVQFSRCRPSNLFQGQIETSVNQVLQSKLERYERSLCPLPLSRESGWWAQVDSNHRPHDYQSCALAS